MPGKLYGVWAAEDPSCELQLVDGDGATSTYVLTGTKAFCTGATIVDRALVTVRREGIAHLLDLDVRDARVTFDSTGWRTPAFAETLTAVATFDDLEVATDDVVGAPGWYLIASASGTAPAGRRRAGRAEPSASSIRRSSAACAKRPTRDRDAQLGALAGLRWQLLAVLDVAGREIDSDPCDVMAAMQRALMLRHTVERAATAIIDLAGRAMGPDR